jgi:hypothetical protein
MLGMSRRVYFHIGAPKTGTTYLQDRLALNRNTLSSHGVHYPLGALNQTDLHFRAALDLLERDWAMDTGGRWDSLMKQVRRLDGTVIVSHEVLASATDEQVRRAMHDVGDAEVHIVYSARDLARQIPAAWQESIKNRKSWSYRSFLKKVQEKPQIKADWWFWKVQSLPDVLSRWSAGLAPEQVHLVTVPPAGAPQGLLWQRFCDAFGIDPAWAPLDSVRANPSMGIAETTVVRKLNRRLNKTDMGVRDKRRLVKELLVHGNLAHRPDMKKPTLPPDRYEWANGVAESWIDWIEGAGIDVVGDVDDLRPGEPPKERWRDPDRPSRKKMLDAAVEALSVMTQEAARCGETEPNLIEKVGKAARSIRA